MDPKWNPKLKMESRNPKAMLCFYVVIFKNKFFSQPQIIQILAIKNSPVLSPQGDQESDSDDTIDAEGDQAEEQRIKMMKKAGLPQFCADTLPSSIATKMMTLDIYNEKHLK